MKKLVLYPNGALSWTRVTLAHLQITKVNSTFKIKITIIDVTTVFDKLVRRLQREDYARKQQHQQSDKQRISAQMRHLIQYVTDSRLVQGLLHRVGVEQGYRAYCLKKTVNNAPFDKSL